MNQELNDYVSKSRVSGMSDEDIKKQLLSSGWQESDVSEAMAGEQATTPEPAVEAPLEIPPEQPKKTPKKWIYSVVIVVILLVILFLPVVLFLDRLHDSTSYMEEAFVALKNKEYRAVVEKCEQSLYVHPVSKFYDISPVLFYYKWSNKYDRDSSLAGNHVCIARGYYGLNNLELTDEHMAKALELDRENTISSGFFQLLSDKEGDDTEQKLNKEPYIDPEGFYSILIPSGWTKVEGRAEFEPGGDAYIRLSDVFEVRESVQLKIMVDELRTTWENERGMITLEQEDISIDSIPAILLKQKGKGGQDLEHDNYMLSVHFIYEKRSFTAWGVVSEPYWVDYGRIVEEALLTYKPLK